MIYDSGFGLFHTFCAYPAFRIVVDMGDALYIARYTVGLETPDTDHFNFTGDVQPASDSDHITNMGDALYFARYTVNLETAP